MVENLPDSLSVSSPSCKIGPNRVYTRTVMDRPDCMQICRNLPAFSVDLAAFSVDLATFSVDLAAFSVDLAAFSVDLAALRAQLDPNVGPIGPSWQTVVHYGLLASKLYVKCTQNYVTLRNMYVKLRNIT